MSTQENDTNKNTVTFAKPDDITQIISFAYNTYKDVDLPLASPDFAKITAEITEAVIQEVALVVRNEANPKMIDGCIVFKHASPWWSKEIMLQQLFFFVKPELRGKGLFKDLLNAAEEYGKMNNLTLLQEIVGKDFDKKGKILSKKGYTPIGCSYILSSKEK